MLCGNLIQKCKRDNKVSLIPAFKIGVWNAWLFMSVFLLQMTAILFVDKRIREKSHVPADTKRNRSERFAGILGNLAWLLAMGYSVFLPLQLGTIWFSVGLSVFAIGLIIMAISTFNFLTTPVDLVITKGAYRLSRHPMYLATFLICLGSGIATLSWLFIFLSVIMILCFRQEALIEERYCLREYGSAYQEYLSSVPRWFGVPDRIG